MEQRTRKRLQRRLVYYFVLTNLAGVVIGLLGNWTSWSNEIALLATVIVIMPISLAFARDLIDLLRAREEQRGNPRPAP